MLNFDSMRFGSYILPPQFACKPIRLFLPQGLFPYRYSESLFLFKASTLGSQLFPYPSRAEIPFLDRPMHGGAWMMQEYAYT